MHTYYLTPNHAYEAGQDGVVLSLRRRNGSFVKSHVRIADTIPPAAQETSLETGRILKRIFAAKCGEVG